MGELEGRGTDMVASRRFVAVPCKITRSRVVEKSPYRAEITYEYRFDGAVRSGAVIYDGYRGAEDYYEAQALRERYPAGALRECLVDPKDPARAVLERRSAWVMLLPVVLTGFVALLGAGVYLVWRPARGGAAGVWTRHRNLMLGPFFGVFLVAGVAVLVMFVPLLKRGRAARAWPAVSCKVASASVSEHESHSDHGDTTTYGVEVLFHYHVNGKRYGSSRYAVGSTTSSDQQGKRRVVEDLLAHRNRVCYVNPLDPGDAVLSKSYGTAAILAGGIGGLFTLVGGAGLAVVAWMAMKARWGPEEAVADGDATSVLSPGIKAATMWGFALVWNAIVALFAALLWSTHAEGERLGMMPIVVVSVLGACGMVVLGAAVVSLRELGRGR